MWSRYCSSPGIMAVIVEGRNDSVGQLEITQLRWEDVLTPTLGKERKAKGKKGGKRKRKRFFKQLM